MQGVENLKVRTSFLRDFRRRNVTRHRFIITFYNFWGCVTSAHMAPFGPVCLETLLLIGTPVDSASSHLSYADIIDAHYIWF